MSKFYDADDAAWDAGYNDDYARGRKPNKQQRHRQTKWDKFDGDLDSPVPNHFDPTKRGFQPQ